MATWPWGGATIRRWMGWSMMWTIVFAQLHVAGRVGVNTPACTSCRQSTKGSSVGPWRMGPCKRVRQSRAPRAAWRSNRSGLWRSLATGPRPALGDGRQAGGCPLPAQLAKARDKPPGALRRKKNGAAEGPGRSCSRPHIAGWADERNRHHICHDVFFGIRPNPSGRQLPTILAHRSATTC